MSYCVVESCNKPTKSKGYCSGHYHRLQRYGDPIGKPANKPSFVRGVCIVDGCLKLKHGALYCGMHYVRMKLYGDPYADIPPVPKGQGKKRPYTKRIYKPLHPIATKNGTVELHRFLLYNEIGVGPHFCHWCNKIIYWKVELVRSEDSIVVDHLDFNRRNNNLDNLVPSCHSCNSARHAHTSTQQVGSL